MKALLQAITIVSLLVSLAPAQNTPAEIQNLNVARRGNELNVEVTLSSPVTPNVIVATAPDRLVLELPNTSAGARQKRVPVNQDGVKAIRVGLNSAEPPVTRVVVDLEQARLYRVDTNGSTITLAILPVENSSRRGGPVPAASAPIWGRLHPQKRDSVPAPPSQTATDTVDGIPQPKKFPPIQLPDGTTIPSSTTTAANSKPSAKHPNFGSLQEGTVFPTAGAPGTGYVPAVTAPASPTGATAAAAATKAVPGNTQTAANESPKTLITTAVVARMPQADTPASNQVPSAPSVWVEPAPTVTANLSGRPYPSMAVPAAPQPAPELMAKNTPSITVSTAAAAGVTLSTSNGAASPVQAPNPVAGAKPAAVTTGATTPATASPNASTTSAANASAAAQVSLPSAAAATVPNAATVAASTKPAVANPPVQTSPVASGASATVVAAGNAGVDTTAAAANAKSVTSGSASQTASTSVPNAPSAGPSPTTPGAAGAGSASPSSAPTVAVAKAEPPAAPGSAQPENAPAIINGTAEPAENTPALATRQPNTEIRMGFKVKYVAAGAAYLEGGKNSGLSEGMKLEVRDNLSGADSGTNDAYGPAVADLEVLSVADTSTVAEIHDPKRDVKAGDWAYLSSEDTQTLVAQRSLSPTRKYPAVISFTEGTDPLAEEAHAEVPRPPMPDINRARGRFGFDYSTIRSQGGMASSSMGMSVMTDITRIGGTYWNMTGYWRGRFTSTSGNQVQTLQDLINRTYHLGMFYDNPDSHFVAGFGRLFLPYATSLDTIDGGYAGYRVTKTATIGLFAGSTPDPTSWSYNPQQEIGGTFFNVQGGTFDFWRYSDTVGMGVEMLKWHINRPFVFGENSISFKRFFSVYSAVQADAPAGNAAVAAPGPGLSRSFTTFRIQPFSRIEFDVNHTYFRDIPTFDPALIGTGLLDKYLFQGFSAGTRIEVLKDVWAYTTLGRSSRSGDKSSSLNQLYGVTFGRLPYKIRTDLHYSKFSSSFGAGTYYAGSVSRSFHDNFRWEVLAGKQAFLSSLSTNDSSHFVTGNLDVPIGTHYYMQGGFTWNRGVGQNYNQALFSFGYRFDTRKAGSR